MQARRDANAAVLGREWSERQSALVRGAVGSEQEMQEQVRVRVRVSRKCRSRLGLGSGLAGNAGAG